MNTPLFLLGAGFNKDAKSEAGEINGVDCGYPLVNELYKICFPDKEIKASVSIEELFDDELTRDNFEPLKKLYTMIMKADYFILKKLLKSYNCYSKFFNDYQNSSFLTFNYDSVPEIFLLRLDRWFPHDGYGVPVETELAFNVHKKYNDKISNSFVLHLHGSCCIYTHDIKSTPDPIRKIDWIKIKDKPEFIFDPDSTTDLFHPFNRVLPKISYVPIEKRVIAPVPEKTKKLRSLFIKQVYSKSYDLLDKANVLVVIGYNFSSHDRSSYHPLLEHIAKNRTCKILIISRSQTEIKKRLIKEYPSIEWLSIDDMTFKEWVDSDYDVLEN